MWLSRRFSSEVPSTIHRLTFGSLEYIDGTVERWAEESKGSNPFFSWESPREIWEYSWDGESFFHFFFELTKLGFSKSSWTMSWTGIRFRNQPEKSSGVSKKRNFDKFDQVETPTHGTGTWWFLNIQQKFTLAIWGEILLKSQVLFNWA